MALPPDMAERAIKELGGARNLKVKTAKPEPAPKTPKRPDPVVTLPVYKADDKVATRKAYGDALVALGAMPDVVAMDGEVSNSTHADEFAKAYPDRFFEMWIAEHNTRLAGSHAGVEIGQDGPSQMALEDLAAMRAIIGSTVLYPSDPNQA